ncbi:MAG: cyclic pyranopterin monophosphate synthase MoaC [Thermoanaerobaculia bacterium]
MPSKTKPGLTHLDAEGGARMVDVSKKRSTLRRAVARAVVELGPRASAALAPGENPKGDAFAVARIAGIQAAKRTSDWIPLCHPIAFDSVEVSLVRVERTTNVEIRATVGGTGKTGFEMEALVAASAAALALYDMCKGVEKGIRIGPIELVSKSGGRSGSWSRKLSG